MLGKRYRFDPDYDWFGEALEMIPKIEDSDIEVHLDSQDSLQKVRDEFICIICKDVVLGP
jgi:hypothetical protein